MTQFGDTPRVETRFAGTDDLVDPLPEGIDEIHHSANTVSTVVFGRHNPQDGIPVPLGGTLRFRYYSADLIPRDNEACVLDPRQLGTLMLKHYRDANAAKPENRKHTVTNVALGEVCRFLETPALRGGLFQYDGGTELVDLIEEHYGRDISIMPLMVVEARRRHLSAGERVTGIGPARVTFDQGTTWWPVVERKPGDVLAACKALTLHQNILEVKRAEPLDPASETCRKLLGSLFGDNQDYTAQGRMKRIIGGSITEKRGTPRLINGEWNQRTTDPSRPSEAVRFVNEREIKIDTSIDPREVIKSIPTRPKDGVCVDPGFPRRVKFRFHIFEGSGEPIVAVEKHNYNEEGELIGVGFQYKRTLSDESTNDVLVRSEVMAPSLAELWKITGQTPGELVGVTQLADRNRIHRRAVCEKTGNVFLILADYCTAESNDRPPLAQVEVEFRGKYSFKDVASAPHEKQIAADFELVRGVVLNTLNTRDIQTTDKQTTKQAWLTAETIRENK